MLGEVHKDFVVAELDAGIDFFGVVVRLKPSETDTVRLAEKARALHHKQTCARLNQQERFTYAKCKIDCCARRRAKNHSAGRAAD